MEKSIINNNYLTSLPIHLKAKAKDVIIGYHANCLDGCFSCLTLENGFEIYLNDDVNVETIPINHGDKQEFNFEQFVNKDVFLVDFSFGKEETLKLFEMLKRGEIKSLSILDHHATFNQMLNDVEVKEKIKDTPRLYIEFDNEHSGAYIAQRFMLKLLLNYNFESTKYDNEEIDQILEDKIIENEEFFVENVSRPILLIEDNDLYVNKYKETEAFTQILYQHKNKFLSVEKGQEKIAHDEFKKFLNVYLDGQRVFFEKIQKLEDSNEIFYLNFKEKINYVVSNYGYSDHVFGIDKDILNETIKEGETVLEFYNQQISKALLKKEEIAIEIDGKMVKGHLINTDSQFINKLSNRIYTETESFVGVWELLADNKVKLGLRSHPNVDCSIIAKSLNGGGHRCASSATLPSLDDFMELRRQWKDNVKNLELNNSIDKTISQNLNKNYKINFNFI